MSGAPQGWTRRGALGGFAALAACGPRDPLRGDVLAAGQPAAVLLSALAPARMIGWPRRPPAAALALIGGPALAETGALTGGGAPLGLEAAAALRPRLILDYGDVNPRMKAIAERTEARLDAPYHLIDGALQRIPQAFARAGQIIGEEARGNLLAERAAAVLAGWRGAFGAGPSFYYARGGDGLETGFAGSLATEVLEGAGWRNVAAGAAGVGRTTKERIVAWDPEVLVTLDMRFVRGASRDPLWSKRRGGAKRRILLLPDLPFGWMDRPPSVNRLLGCAWLAGGDKAAREVAGWLWRIAPGPLSALGGRWLA